MRKTRHAKIRQQHRGIPDLIVELILQFGSSYRTAVGALAFELPSGFPQVLDKAQGVRVIMDDSGNLITVEHKIKGSNRRRKDHNPPCPSRKKR